MSRQAPAMHFDIARITLYGYSARDRDRFERALRTHLTELAAGQQGSWPADGSQFIDRLDAGTVPAGASPERAARVIAARVLGAVADPRAVASPTGTAGATGTASPTGTADTTSTASPAGDRRV